MLPPRIQANPYIWPLPKTHPSSYPAAALTQAGCDQVQFGAAEIEMPFVQNRAMPTAGTLTQPVSPNNCLVCSAKNLLAFYGYPKLTINNIVQDSLLQEIRNPQYFTQDSPYYQRESSKAVELNNDFVRSFMTSASWGLHMDIEPLRINDLDKLKKAVHDRKPIWVFAEGDAQTLAANAQTTTGGTHQLIGGHAYVVVPDKNKPDNWLIMDSWAGKTSVSSQQLLQNLEALKASGQSGQSQYNIVHRGPDQDLMAIYEGPIKKPKPAGPSVSTKTSSPKNKTTRPASKPSPAKQPNLWQKTARWFHRQWQQFTSAFKRLKNWIKSWFQ